MTRRPMTPQDSLWLELDRPTNLMAITSLLWTVTPVDPGRLRAVIAERLVERYPVFRQRPVLHGGLLRWGYWADDPAFDLGRHVVFGTLPPPGDRASLEAFVGAQRELPLDRAHPLWRIHVLQGYGEGTAVVQRYHHAMADGVRLTQVMLGILDPVGDGRPDLAARVGGRTPTGGSGLAAGALSLLRTAGSVVKIGLWTNPENALAGRPGIRKTAAWGDPVPLRLLSALADRTGTTVNDVCMALVAGAVARYLERQPGGRLPTGDDDLAWMVPVNLDPPGSEPPQALGNHFALVLAVLPHGPAGFPTRLAEVHRRMNRIRASWEPMLTFGLSRGIAMSPSPFGTAVSRVLAAKAVGVLTNVPGPRAPMELAGARVAGVVGWAPSSGRQTLTVCIFSYAGEVTVGFGTDGTVIPDPQALVADLAAEVSAAAAEVHVAAGAG